MSKVSFIDDEYEIQHYGFSSTEFISQFRSILFMNIKTVLTDMKESISGKLKLNKEDDACLDTEMSALISLSVNKITKELDAIEAGIHHFFNIPKHISLKGDELNVDDANAGDIANEIKKLEDEYKRELMLQAIYQRELNTISQLKNIEQNLTKTLNLINDLPSIEGYGFDMFQFVDDCYKELVSFCLTNDVGCINDKNENKRKFKVVQ